MKNIVQFANGVMTISTDASKRTAPLPLSEQTEERLEQARDSLAGVSTEEEKPEEKEGVDQDKGGVDQDKGGADQETD